MKKLKNLNKIYTSKNFFALILITVFFSISVYKISLPGIQYDEILFGNAALGGVGSDKSFITKEFYGVPIFLMQYIGALKAYIYYPIFEFLGTNAYSIRLPMVILSAISLILIYSTLKKRYSLQLALIVLFLLSTNNSIINLTRTDVGPNAIEFFLKSVALSWLITGNLKGNKILYLIPVFLLGVFNKLNFVWFINSFFLVLFILELGTILELLKTRSFLKLLKKYIYYIISYSVLILFLIIVQRVLNVESNLQFDTNTFQSYFNNINEIIDGTAYYNYAIGNQNSSFNLMYSFFLLTLITFGTVSLFSSKNKKNIKLHLILIIFILSSIFQIIITPQATAPWHAFTIEPFFTLLVGLSIYEMLIVGTNSTNISKRLSHFFTFLILSTVGIYSFNLAYEYNNHYSNPDNVIWSTTIYELLDYTKKSDRNFASADWGFHTQLITSDPDDSKYKEVFWFLLKEEYSEQDLAWFKSNFIDKDFDFILHSEDKTIFEQARTNLFIIHEELNLRLVIKKEFYQNDNLVYEIYTLDS